MANVRDCSKEKWFGASPARDALHAIKLLNALHTTMQTPHAIKLERAISFWETRKVRGLLAIFNIGHNMHCGFRSAFYRAKLAAFIDKEVPELKAWRK